MKLVAFIQEGFFVKNYYFYKQNDKYHLKAKGMIKKIMPLYNRKFLVLKWHTL